MSIPVISIRGTHRQVGRQIGERLKPNIERLIGGMKETLPAGIHWEKMLLKSQLCLAYTRAAFPQYIEELEGIAEGSGFSLQDIFLAHCEELWEPAAWSKGCTDMAARGSATIDGSTLLAHTNDMAPKYEKELVILKVQAGDEPEFLGVSIAGLGYSSAFNAAGISLTGNEVTSNDVRPGVPRIMVVRAILAARRLGEAMDACLLPTRASSYNNLIADTNGEVYCMEGSATDCEPIYIDDDILAHANHYVSPAMRRFEAHRNDISGSIIRYNRAYRLLRENKGKLSVERFKQLLADHANFPASICKHKGVSITVFSIIIKLDELRAWIGLGRPCRPAWQEFSLEPWKGS